MNGLPVDFANVYIALLRVAAPVLMIWILWRAGKPLLSFRKEPEIWAMLRLPDGKGLPDPLGEHHRQPSQERSGDPSGHHFEKPCGADPLR